MIYLKRFCRHSFFLLLVLLVSSSLINAEVKEKEETISNYPLHFVRYISGRSKKLIYTNNEEETGKNLTKETGKEKSEWIDDDENKGGTPVACVQSSKGYIYVLYTANRANIQVFDKTGKYLFSFDKLEREDSLISTYMCGLAINSKDEIFVSDVKKKQIQVFDQYGKYLGSFSSTQGLSPNDPKQDIYPAHISIDHMDKIYISDGLNGHVYIHNSQGKLLNILRGPESGLFPTAAHIRFDSNGRIYILEGLGNCCIQVCSYEGEPIMCLGKIGSRAGEFQRISGLAIDSHDRIYATDVVQCVIQIFNTNGELIGIVKEIVNQGKSQRLKTPTGIFIDQDDFIYVIEQPLHRVIVLRNPDNVK